MGKTEDRISNLPDSLLHHILSYLEIKVVARTCILSRRWNYIWISIPNLEFQWGPDTDKFMNFVEGTLNRHSLSSNIQKFSLRSYENLDESRVYSWISSVMMRHNLKELSLYLTQCYPLLIPPSVFTCASLVSLELQTHPIIRFRKCIAFPQLKRLQLCDIDLTVTSWNDKLFSNSPVLEELCLDSCSFFLPSFCISIPALKRLKINDAYGMRDCALKIHAPNLTSLYYRGCVAKEYVLSFVSLAEAAVYFRVELGARNTDIDVGVSQLFQALAHVKCLTVGDPPRRYKESSLLNRLPTYHNIKHLKITGIPIYCDAMVPALLKVTPNLESLVMEKYDMFQPPDCIIIDSESDEESHDNEEEGNIGNTSLDHSEHDGWTSLDMVASTGCLFLHLKSVCFKPVKWSPRAIICVKAILRNAKALQLLNIHHDYSKRSLNVLEQELMEQIESFPRASASCNFKICSE